jgi:hypothetical protein
MQGILRHLAVLDESSRQQLTDLVTHFGQIP